MLLKNLQDLTVDLTVSYSGSSTGSYSVSAIFELCNVAMVTTGVIWGSSREKHYLKLDLEFLQQLRWYKKLCYFLNNRLKINLPTFWLILSPLSGEHIEQENIDSIYQFKVKHTCFRNLSFQSIVIM